MKLENRAIQTIGDGILIEAMTKMFAYKDFELLHNKTQTEQEIGTDIYFEVKENSSGKHALLFLNQNKSTNEEVSSISKPNSNYQGFISFQIELRHANYFYYELQQPLLFTRTDCEKRIVYWYFIQLDSSIENRIQEANKKGNKSIQVYIDPSKQINPQNFDGFFRELTNCKIHQIRKQSSWSLGDGDFMFKHDEYIDLNMLDKLLKTINEFHPLKVVPFNILKWSYPFAINSPCEINSTYLYSDNKELYSFLNKISIDDEGLYHIEDSDYNKTTDLQKKIDDVLSFFSNNLIHHFGSSRNNKQNILCIHKLFNPKPCDCGRCSFNMFKLEQSQKSLDGDFSSISVSDKLTMAFTAYFLGDVSKSFEIYKSVYLNAEPDSFDRVLSGYNLQRIKPYLNHFAVGQLGEEDSKFISNANLGLSDLTLKKHVPGVVDWLKNHKFLYYNLIEMDDIHFEVEHIYRNDKFGGTFRNEKFYRATYLYNSVITFVEGNLLIFQDYQDFNVLIRKYFEINVALQNIRNPDTSKSNGIDSVLIRHLMLFVKPKVILKVLRKYDIQKLKVYDLIKAENYIFETLTNLTNYFENNPTIKSNYLLKDRIDYTIKSLGVFLSYIEFSSQTFFEETLLKYLELVSSVEKILDSRFLEMQLIFKKTKIENKRILENCLPYWLQENRLYEQTTYHILKNLEDAGLIKKHEVSIQEAIGVNKEDFEQHFFNNIHQYDFLLDVHLVKEMVTSRIKHLALERLRNKFNPTYFYNLTIREIIPFELALLENFKNSIPDLGKEKNLNPLFRNSRINSSLSDFINLMLFFDIPFDASHQKLSSLAVNKEYYDWLMDIDNFDYKLFCPDWILLYKTSPYFNHIKKSKIAMGHIINSVGEKYTEGLGVTVIRHLLN